MARKKATKTVITKTEIFEDPQSRNEALLQNILGANNDLGDPQSRNEALLMNILGESYDIGEAQSRIETLLMRIKEEGLGTKITAADLGKVVQETAPGEYGLVAQTAHAQITENGTFDTTNNNSVEVNVSGGGGGGDTGIPADYRGLSYGYIDTSGNLCGYGTKNSSLNLFHLTAGKTYMIMPGDKRAQSNRKRIAFFPGKTAEDFTQWIETAESDRVIYNGTLVTSSGSTTAPNYTEYTPAEDGELAYVTSNENIIIEAYCVANI